MGFALETGYVPLNIDDIMSSIMDGVNAQFGTSYTIETFTGTNMYKYFYALAQRVQTNEIKASEVFIKLQDYFKIMNETILDPKVTPNGIVQAFKEAGYTASVKPMELADAGKANICVDVDETAVDYALKKLAICNLIKDYVVAGVITEGTESELLTLTNGQQFTFSYRLPIRTEIKLKLTLTLSRNNRHVIASPEETKNTLMANIAELYSLGKDFEPERYFSASDAPWTSDILLEYSIDNGVNWLDTVYESDYNELFVVLLENIDVIES